VNCRWWAGGAAGLMPRFPAPSGAVSMQLRVGYQLSITALFVTVVLTVGLALDQAALAAHD